MKSTFINMSLNLIYLVWIRSVKIIISCFFVLFRLQKWMRFGVRNTACLNKATVMLTWLKDDDSCLSTCMNWKRVEKVSMAYSICRVWHKIPFVVFLRFCFVGSKAKLINVSSMQSHFAKKHLANVLFSVPPWIAPGVACLISLCINNPCGSRVSIKYTNCTKVQFITYKTQMLEQNCSSCMYIHICMHLLCIYLALLHNLESCLYRKLCM